jgi:hypothetical protein
MDVVFSSGESNLHFERTHTQRKALLRFYFASLNNKFAISCASQACTAGCTAGCTSLGEMCKFPKS